MSPSARRRSDSRPASSGARSSRGAEPRAKPATDSPLGRRLRNPSAGVAAAAGVGTHLPGLIYLAALNVIASERPGPVSAGVRVALYDALWFLVPLAALALVVFRPGAALVYLEDGTAWAQRHERVLLVARLAGARRLPRRQGAGGAHLTVADAGRVSPISCESDDETPLRGA